MTQENFYLLNSNLQDQKGRLKWACRRGMLELDLILSRFLSEAYDLLSPEEQANFRTLTAVGDQELFNWLFNQTSDPPHQYITIFKKIKDYSYG